VRRITTLKAFAATGRKRFVFSYACAIIRTNPSRMRISPLEAAIPG